MHFPLSPCQSALQDIDYLPEKGVDYSDCEVPMQLSAEIAPGIETSQGPLLNMLFITYINL